MSRKGLGSVLISLIVVGVLVIGVAGFYFYSHGNTRSSEPQAQPAVIPSAPATTTPSESRSVDVATSTVSTSSTVVTCATCNWAGEIVASSTYRSPYSVTWSKGSVRVHLVGVTVVKPVSTSTSLVESKFGNRFLTLFFRVINPSSTTPPIANYSVLKNLRVIYDESGTTVAPINSTSAEELPSDWPNAGDLNPTQSVSFLVPSNATYFDLTTEESSVGYFFVKINDNNTIDAQMELTSEPPNTVAPPICGEKIRNVPGHYTSIQAAIDAADSGDTIQVAAGTYVENLKMKSRLCLSGAGIDRTIIAKSGAPGITVSGVSDVIIKGITVKNSGRSQGDEGGGIKIFSSDNISLDVCRLTGNSVVNGGGMMIEKSTDVFISHCLIDNNHANNIGGGVLVENGSTATFINVTIASNSANSSWGGIGGLAFSGSRLNIANSILWGNSGAACCGNIGSANFAASNASYSVSYSDIGGWNGGIGNVDVDPQFISSSDYQLKPGSTAAKMGAFSQ